MKTRIHPPMMALLALLFLAAPTPLSAQLFTKITTGPFVTTPSGSRSVNFLDTDNDGFQDILISNGKQGGEDNMLYHNEHDGTFTLANDTVCHDGKPSDGATCADYDNDGYTDIFVVNWYGVDNMLYHHNAASGYVQVDTGIVPNDGGYSETAAWGDMDDDGLLDLYVTNSDGNFRNFLYHNLGDGAFEKIAGIAPVTDAFASRCNNWIDYDMDGDQDLFVANESNQRNQLYRNDGYPVFTKVLTGPVVTTNFSSHSSSWADYDNDGDFDLLVANYNQAEQLFQNDGAGNFTQVSSPFGVDLGCSFSSSFADYDNDADLDLFVTNGFCTSYTHNYLYENDGTGQFTRNLTEPMATDSGSSYGCAWGDYDNDGFLDLAVANWRGEVQPNSLYHNDGNHNHWMELKLEGVISNRSAIGAIVRCLAIVNGDPVWQMREVSAQTGYCSQNSLVVHFGLGDASTIDSLEVWWPSGILQTFWNVSSNSLNSLVENGSLVTVGMADHAGEGMDVRVFPNPSDGKFMVEVEKPGGFSEANAVDPSLRLEVLDAMGRLAFAQDLQSGSSGIRIPLALKLPNGLYIVRVSGNESGTIQRRIVIGN